MSAFGRRGGLIDLLDANESIWAFVLVDRVGSAGKSLVGALIMLANDGAWRICCGRSADAEGYPPDFADERAGAVPIEARSLPGKSYPRGTLAPRWGPGMTPWGNCGLSAECGGLDGCGLAARRVLAPTVSGSITVSRASVLAAQNSYLGLLTRARALDMT
jgi:hypothetical protein